MPMNITFELSDKDLLYFKRIMSEVRARSAKIDEAKLIGAVRKLIDEIRTASTTPFVVQRLQKLERMVKMLEDKEWDMAGKDRGRVADGLVYFAEGEDLIPDRIPGLGYLDDAIMIELVVQDLKHEIEAYDDFCRYRASKEKLLGRKDVKASREKWISARREQLQSRMRRRRRRDRSSGGKPTRLPSSLF
ncbi:MAG TPA: YkvA family protein [Myxococcota bacterium]|nr:YkvA family protein [Myxococcota bacterium]